MADNCAGDILHILIFAPDAAKSAAFDDTLACDMLCAVKGMRSATARSGDVVRSDERERTIKHRLTATHR